MCRFKIPTTRYTGTTHSRLMNEQLPCLVCDKALPADPTARCLTDCSHEFCLACLCRVLTTLKNRCPGCHVQVKQVTQLQPQSPATPPPATVRFCNAIYTLNVSIWAVKDPAKTLASLFHLEHARLIHKGKVLKKGDVWPGSVVQLVGSRKGTLQTAAMGNYMTWLRLEWVQRAKALVCCPFNVVYDFIRSLFTNLTGQQRGYTLVPTQGTSSTSTFRAPGHVPSPHSTNEQ